MSFDFQFRTNSILKPYMPLTGGLQQWTVYAKNADVKAL